MIFITFDMDDPRVVYDSPNVVCNEEGVGVLLEFGDPGYTQLAPGQPGYEAPPQPKARRRSYRSPVDKPKNTTHMDSHFHFNVIPKPGGSVVGGLWVRDARGDNLPLAQQARQALRGFQYLSFRRVKIKAAFAAGVVRHHVAKTTGGNGAAVNGDGHSAKGDFAGPYVAFRGLARCLGRHARTVARKLHYF